MPLQFMLCAPYTGRIGMAARKEGSRAAELTGTPVGQIVGMMNHVQTSAQVIYELVDEYVDAVNRMQSLAEGGDS